jgi:hypothetical protein
VRAQLGRILARVLQVILHVKVIGNGPSQPEVVAWHVW